MDLNSVRFEVSQRLDGDDLLEFYKQLMFSEYNVLESKELLYKLSEIHDVPYKSTFKEFLEE